MQPFKKKNIRQQTFEQQNMFIMRATMRKNGILCFCVIYECISVSTWFLLPLCQADHLSSQFVFVSAEVQSLILRIK